MKRVIWLFLIACATTPRGDLYERPATATARLQVLELGWDAVEDPQLGHPPVVDVMRPKRYRGLVLEEATDLAAKCNAGETPFEALMRKAHNEGSEAPVTVESGSKLAYRDAALRLRVGECTVVEGPASDYVLKRIE